MKLKKETDKTVLFLEGEMTVKNAASFWDQLLQAFKKDELVEINFEKVSTVDLSCLQLIFSAYRFAENSGKKLVVIADDNSSFDEAHARSGIKFDKYSSFNGLEQS